MTPELATPDQVTPELRAAIARMADAIGDIMSGQAHSVYLHGSLTLGDFRPGWSDIDILCLTRGEIAPARAEKLLTLRQTLLESAPGNPYYRAFEGGLLPLEAFVAGAPARVVYWGTSGQRLTDTYRFDSFCTSQWLDNGALLRGADVRAGMKRPERADFARDIARLRDDVRTYARETRENLYAFGWLLDIARCLYTLRYARVLAKTAAGEWALAQGLCPVPEALAQAIALRRDPALLQRDAALRARAGALGADIQRFCDVLDAALESAAEGRLA